MLSATSCSTHTPNGASEGDVRIVSLSRPLDACPPMNAPKARPGLFACSRRHASAIWPAGSSSARGEPLLRDAPGPGRRVRAPSSGHRWSGGLMNVSRYPRPPRSRPAACAGSVMAMKCRPGDGMRRGHQVPEVGLERRHLEGRPALARDDEAGLGGAETCGLAADSRLVGRVEHDKLRGRRPRPSDVPAPLRRRGCFRPCRAGRRRVQPVSCRGERPPLQCARPRPASSPGASSQPSRLRIEATAASKSCEVRVLRLTKRSRVARPDSGNGSRGLEGVADAVCDEGHGWHAVWRRVQHSLRPSD